jgi:HlyD family secretion protein
MMQRLHRLWIRRKALVLTIVILAGCGVVLGAVRLTHRAPTVATLEVKRGEFLDSLQFRGEVKALKSITISAPADVGDLQIVKLATDGSVVKPGDVVVEFDHTRPTRTWRNFAPA